MEKVLLKSLEQYLELLRKLFKDPSIDHHSFAENMYPENYPCVALYLCREQSKPISTFTEQTWDELIIGFVYYEDFDERTYEHSGD